VRTFYTTEIVDEESYSDIARQGGMDNANRVYLASEADAALAALERKYSDEVTETHELRHELAAKAELIKALEAELHELKFCRFCDDRPMSKPKCPVCDNDE
jgi:hypothetical protein